MSGRKYGRKRNQTLCYRATPEERLQIEARIKISGLEKGEYYRQSLLHQQITVIRGKYESDKLAAELKWLREDLKTVECDAELKEVLMYCKALLEELLNISQNK